MYYIDEDFHFRLNPYLKYRGSRRIAIMTVNPLDPLKQLTHMSRDYSLVFYDATKKLPAGGESCIGNKERVSLMETRGMEVARHQARRRHRC